jgi:hypothetical protein
MNTIDRLLKKYPEEINEVKQLPIIENDTLWKKKEVV